MQQAQTKTATQLMEERAKILYAEVEKELLKIIAFYNQNGKTYDLWHTYMFSDDVSDDIKLRTAFAFVKSLSDKQTSVSAHVYSESKQFKFKFVSAKQEKSRLFSQDTNKWYGVESLELEKSAIKIDHVKMDSSTVTTEPDTIDVEN